MLMTLIWNITAEWLNASLWIVVVSGAKNTSSRL